MPWYIVHEKPVQVPETQVDAFLAENPTAARCAPPPWKPRASLLGAYMSCLYRAAADRAAHEEIPGCWQPRLPENTAYADHGTICHYLAQTAIPADFFEERPPTEEQYAQARTLFASELEHKNIASLAASVAISLLPSIAPGVRWRAEEAWELDTVTGHTDLRTSCGTYVVDFKFTHAPPKNHRIKPEHLPQMAAYSAFTQARFIRVIYVDALKAQWAVSIDIDCQKPGWRWYVDQVLAFTRFCCSPALFEAAMPVIGEHCGRLWCPYRFECADQVAPAPGVYVDALRARLSKGPFRITVPTWVENP